MPGSLYIFGILCCYNERLANKGCTFSYNADFVIVFEGDEVKKQKALLIHFTLQESKLFVDQAFYSVSGKVATTDSSFDVGGGVNVDDYQLFIEANEVCHKLSSLFKTGAGSAFARKRSCGHSERAHTTNDQRQPALHLNIPYQKLNVQSSHSG